MSDEPLIGILRKDPEHDAAWKELYQRHSEALLRTAYSIIGDRAAAEDVVNETFLQAYRYLPSFREECSFKGWLLTIATNLCRRFLIAKGRERHTRERITAEARHDAVHIPDASIQQEIQEKVRGALQSLSPEQRVAVTLSCIEGLSTMEIATILGCKEGTVWSRVYYAKRELARRLEASGVPGKEGAECI